MKVSVFKITLDGKRDPYFVDQYQVCAVKARNPKAIMGHVGTMTEEKFQELVERWGGYEG